MLCLFNVMTKNYESLLHSIQKTVFEIFYGKKRISLEACILIYRVFSFLLKKQSIDIKASFLHLCARMIASSRTLNELSQRVWVSFDPLSRFFRNA